jgi:hypothetical protein
MEVAGSPYTWYLSLKLRGSKSHITFFLLKMETAEHCYLSTELHNATSQKIFYPAD